MLVRGGLFGLITIFSSVGTLYVQSRRSGVVESNERNRDIDNHIQMVNIRKSILEDAKRKFEDIHSKLTDKEKKILEKKRPLICFPQQSDFLDWQRYECESILQKRKKFVKEVKKE